MSLSFNSFFNSCALCSYSLFNFFNLSSDIFLSFNSFSIPCIFCLCLKSNMPNSFLYSSSDMFLSFNSFFNSFFSLFNLLFNIFSYLIFSCFEFYLFHYH